MVVMTGGSSRPSASLMATPCSLLRFVFYRCKCGTLHICREWGLGGERPDSREVLSLASQGTLQKVATLPSSALALPTETASGSDKVRLPTLTREDAGSLPQSSCYVIPRLHTPHTMTEGLVLGQLATVAPRAVKQLLLRTNTILSSKSTAMAEKMKYGKLLLQNQTSKWKSWESDCLCNISLNCPPFASPWDTDNKRKPLTESENTSTLVHRWIQLLTALTFFFF